MRHSFLSTLKRSSPLLVSMGLSGLVVVGSLFALSKWWPHIEPQPAEVGNVEPPEPPNANRVAAYALYPATTRQPLLETLARQGTPIEQQQAHYVLAADEIRQGHGPQALKWLDGLETRYKLLTPYILTLRAKAHTLDRKTNQANQLWKQVIDQFPQSSAAGEAYAALAKSDPRYGDKAIATLPSHPRTIAIAIERLKKQAQKQAQKQANNQALLLLVAQHGSHLQDYKTYLDLLSKQFGSKLTPQQWQMLAFGYWEKQKYKEAGLAYGRSPSTSQNAYRTARGLQLGKEEKPATVAYQRMIAAFPKAPETPRALMKLADLTDDAAKAIALLDRAIPLSVQLNRPEDAGDALRRKAQRLHKTNPAQQTATETQLLEKFGQTESAAQLRWKRAWNAAKTGQLDTAQQWANEIIQSNPESEQAPQALFWAGKWAERIGKPQERQEHFAKLWQNYPGSYYTWRAAALSGQPMGDFQTLRAQQPILTIPKGRLPLTVGSPVLRELYTLGENQATWEAWQLEYKTRNNPSIPEQLTDGLLRVSAGEYLDGLYMLGNLRDRTITEPEQYPQRATVQALHQNPLYWKALYPIPYWQDIQRWSAQQTLNPVLVLALMRQESRFEPAIESVTGAKGLMQLMPETAAEVAAQLKLKKYQLDQPNDNIRLGTWYLDSTHETFQGNSMLAIASYNAGPGNVSQWLKTLDNRDADVFVESIPFDETQHYVKAVLENYWNYVRLYGDPPTQGLLPTPLTSSPKP
jgi:soluble lytic murein transglycosylase